MAAGLDEAEARRAARARSARRGSSQEQCRDTRRVGLLEDLFKDIRYALRLLADRPASR